MCTRLFFYAIMQTKKVGATKIIDLFKKIHKEENNEATAFVIMLGILSEKMTEITILLESLDKKTDKMLLLAKKEIPQKTEILIIEPMTPEDYMN